MDSFTHLRCHVDFKNGGTVVQCGEPCDVLGHGRSWETCLQGKLFKDPNGKAVEPEDKSLQNWTIESSGVPPFTNPHLKGYQPGGLVFRGGGRQHGKSHGAVNPVVGPTGVEIPDTDFEDLGEIHQYTTSTDPTAIRKDLDEMRARHEKSILQLVRNLLTTAKDQGALLRKLDSLSVLYKSCIAAHTHSEPVAYQADHDTLFNRVRELTKAVKNLDTQVGHAKRERVEIRNLVKEAALTKEQEGAALVRGALGELKKELSLEKLDVSVIGNAVGNFISDDWIDIKNAIFAAASAWENAGNSHIK